MTSRRRIPLLARVVVVATSLALCLGGCASGRVVTVEHTSTSATLVVGDTLVVDLGEVNPSIGDEWRLSVTPEVKVLGTARRVSAEVSPGIAGTSVTLEYRFEALHAGTTTIGFEYSYRGEAGDPMGRSGGDPTPEIAVTVLPD